MLDTIKVRIGCPLRVRALGSGMHRVDQGFTIRLGASGTILDTVELSLPRMFFGGNGQVLENQEQLDAALQKCADLLEHIAEVPCFSEWKPLRVDMAWNFNLPCRALIPVHGVLRVPNYQHEATLFKGGEGVSWRGAKSHKMITLYDKAREMRIPGPGSVLRAEISLRSEQLRRHLPDERWRCFDDLYLKFREIMCTIPPVPSSIKAKNFAEAIGPESVEVRERILSRLSHLSPRTFRQHKRDVAIAAAQLEESFSWSDILPPDGPPEAVHVVRNTRRGRGSLRKAVT